MYQYTPVGTGTWWGQNICSLGIMGTRYIRDAPLQTEYTFDPSQDTGTETIEI